MRSLSNAKSWIAAAVLLAATSTTWESPAFAQFEVKQPEVHKGETHIAYHGAYLNGLPEIPEEAKRHGHELEVLYGITGWWAFGAAAEAEKERGEEGDFKSFKLSEVELLNKLVLLPLEGDGVGLSFFTVYGTTVVKGEDEQELLFGPIIKARLGAFSATGNIFFVRAFGIEERATEDGEVELETTPDHWNFDYRWQAKLQLSELWAFGLEGFGESLDIDNDLMESEPDRHRLGPVIYISLNGDAHRPMPLKDDVHGADHDAHNDHGPKVGLAFGVLFGLNDYTDDVALKWDLEIEF